MSTCDAVDKKQEENLEIQILHQEEYSPRKVSRRLSIMGRCIDDSAFKTGLNIDDNVVLDNDDEPHSPKARRSSRVVANMNGFTKPRSPTWKRCLMKMRGFTKFTIARRRLPLVIGLDDGEAKAERTENDIEIFASTLSENALSKDEDSQSVETPQPISGSRRNSRRPTLLLALDFEQMQKSLALEGGVPTGSPESSSSSEDIEEVSMDNTDIQKHLRALWNATKSSEATACIGKEEYIRLNKLLYKSLVGIDEECNNSSQIAEEDWKTDCKGKSVMDFELFEASMTQLCYVWTEERSLDEYIFLLEDITKRLINPFTNGLYDILDAPSPEEDVEILNHDEVITSLLNMRNKQGFWKFSPALGKLLKIRAASLPALDCKDKTVTRLILNYMENNKVVLSNKDAAQARDEAVAQAKAFLVTNSSSSSVDLKSALRMEAEISRTMERMLIKNKEFKDILHTICDTLFDESCLRQKLYFVQAMIKLQSADKKTVLDTLSNDLIRLQEHNPVHNILKSVDTRTFMLKYVKFIAKVKDSQKVLGLSFLMENQPTSYSIAIMDTFGTIDTEKMKNYVSFIRQNKNDMDKCKSFVLRNHTNPNDRKVIYDLTECIAFHLDDKQNILIGNSAPVWSSRNSSGTKKGRVVTTYGCVRPKTTGFYEEFGAFEDKEYENMENMEYTYQGALLDILPLPSISYISMQDSYQRSSKRASLNVLTVKTPLLFPAKVTARRDVSSAESPSKAHHTRNRSAESPSKPHPLLFTRTPGRCRSASTLPSPLPLNLLHLSTSSSSSHMLHRTSSTPLRTRSSSTSIPSKLSLSSRPTSSSSRPIPISSRVSSTSSLNSRVSSSSSSSRSNLPRPVSASVHSLQFQTPGARRCFGL